MNILRIYAKSREILPIKDELLRISLHNILEEHQEDEIKEKKDLINEIIDKADIVITTCSTSWDDRLK